MPNDLKIFSANSIKKNKKNPQLLKWAKYVFLKKNTMAIKHMKICLLLTTRDMQIKTTRYYLTLILIIILKRLTTGEDVEKSELLFADGKE